MKHKITFLILLYLLAVNFCQGQSKKSVLGHWDLTITVAPQPPTPNRVTFSGNETSGTFVDKNNHSGTWKLEGNKLTWDYTSVPNLKNTFVGALNDDWTTISGTNSGTWQGTEFNGTFEGKLVKEKSETEKWREDLQFLATELPKRHKNAFHTMTPEQFEKAVKDLDAKIPTLTLNQKVMEFSRIVAMVGDGHTGLFPFAEPSLKPLAFPMQLYVFKEGVFVQSASREYENAVGAKILKIGDTPVEKALEIVAPYIPKENSMGVKDLAPLYLVSPDILLALGIIDRKDKVRYLVEKDGIEYTFEPRNYVMLQEVAATTPIFPARQGWIDARKDALNPTPLWIKNQSERFWFEYQKDTRIFYVQINQVLNREDKTLAQFFQEVVDSAKKVEIDKFVLDLRINQGGNNGLVPAIIRGIIQLEKIDQKGKLFVIIGRQVFSAAQNLVNAIEKYTNAVFVGEPTASHINMYGDARRVILPNSKIGFSVSSLWHQDNIELDRRQWTTPQISASLTFADYANNIDTAMQAILNYKPQKSLTDILNESLQSNDLASAKNKIAEFRKNPVNEFVSVETELNIFGYRLMSMQRLNEAIEIFKLNSELYPDSANVYDSLGESLATAGKREEAIKAYEKALQIAPNYPSAVEALRRLKER